MQDKSESKDRVLVGVQSTDPVLGLFYYPYSVRLVWDATAQRPRMWGLRQFDPHQKTKEKLSLILKAINEIDGEVEVSPAVRSIEACGYCCRYVGHPRSCDHCPAFLPCYTFQETLRNITKAPDYVKPLEYGLELLDAMEYQWHRRLHPIFKDGDEGEEPEYVSLGVYLNRLRNRGRNVDVA